MLEIFHIQIIFLVVNFVVTAFSALFPVLFVWWKSKYRDEDQVRYHILLNVIRCYPTQEIIFLK